MTPQATLVRILRLGFTALAAPDGVGFALFKAYKVQERAALSELDGLSDGQIETEMERQYAYLMAHMPRIERGFPRRTWSTWPSVFVMIMSERDDKRFIGNLASFDPEEREDRYGVHEESTLGVYTYSENLDELDDLHLFCKHIVRGSLETLAKAGFSTCNLQSAQDIQPGELLPETVYVRGATWEMGGASTWTVALGTRVDRVYVHNETATFTLPDGSTATGGVVPSVEEE